MLGPQISRVESAGLVASSLLVQHASAAGLFSAELVPSVPNDAVDADGVYNGAHVTLGGEKFANKDIVQGRTGKRGPHRLLLGNSIYIELWNYGREMNVTVGLEQGDTVVDELTLESSRYNEYVKVTLEQAYQGLVEIYDDEGYWMGGVTLEVAPASDE